MVASAIMFESDNKDNENVKVIGARSEKIDDKLVILSEDTVGYTEIIINGKKVSYEEMKTLNPDMIESMTVLKNPDKLVIKLKHNPADSKTIETDSRESTQASNYGTIKKPAYEGGEEKLARDISKRLRYPYEAYQNKIHGTVVVQFTVTKSGQLKDFKILQSVDSDLDVAAVNTIKDLPGRWIPGQIDGVVSDISYSLPIVFNIQK